MNKKQLIFEIVFIIIVLLLAPIYKNHILVTEYETQLCNTVDCAIDRYNAYKESGDKYDLEMLACELYSYHRVLVQLEDMRHLEKNSTEVMAVVNLLQSDKEDYEDIDDLGNGLQFLLDDVHSDAGYSMLLSFYNKNMD